MRRLLNWVSGVLLVALALHWLPDVLQTKTNTRTVVRPFKISFTPTPTPPRGAGWKRSGPDWAQSIAFSPDGSSGYACGSPSPENAPILFAVYDVTKGIWRQPTGRGSGVICRVFVSPISNDDILLETFNCINCAHTAAHVYRSRDRGNNWSQVPLPASYVAYDFAWTTTALFVAAYNNNASTADAHVFIVHDDNSFAEIPSRQLIGYPRQINDITLLSSGLIIYATVDAASCSTDCATIAYSTDDGAHWDQNSSIYKWGSVRPVAIKSGTNDLLAWASLASPAAQVLLRSTDSGRDWLPLPPLSSYQTDCTQVFYSIDNAIYVWCYGSTNAIYKLPSSAGQWQMIAPVSDGPAQTVQYDSTTSQAVALWALASDNPAAIQPPGLEYYLLGRGN